MLRLAAIAVTALMLLMAPPALAAPETIPAGFDYEFTGSDLRIRKDLGGTSAYTRHAVTYRAGDLEISGILVKPRGSGPFPVVVLAHG